MITATFTGGEELAAALSGLPDAMAKAVRVEALKAGAVPMRDQMAVNAPIEAVAKHQDVGHIRDNIVISTARSIDGGVTDNQQSVVAVGPSKGAFWGGLNELGTAHIPARAFARPAFDTTAQQSLDIIGEQAWLAITRKLSRSKPPVGFES